MYIVKALMICKILKLRLQKVHFFFLGGGLKTMSDENCNLIVNLF